MNLVHELRIGEHKPQPRPIPQADAATTTHRGKSIALFGLFGCGNFGNDASLEAMISSLRESLPDARLSCICKDPGVISGSFGIEAVQLRGEEPAGTGPGRLLRKLVREVRDLVHAVRHMRKTDILVVPGTGILDDFGVRPTSLPLDVFNWCLAARLVGTRIAFVSIGAGPIGNRFSRWLMASAARMARYRSYRDTGSRDFLKNEGVDTSRDVIYPDLAFKLPVPPSLETVSRTQLIVGVGVMNYRGWYAFQEQGQAIFDDYILKMTEFVALLLAGGHGVRLLTGDKDDVPAVEAIVATLGDTHVGSLTYEPVHSIHDVIRQATCTDLVIATRFHNVVAALMAGKPVISLGYAPKNALLLAEMGLGDYCQNVEDFDVGLLAEQFARLADNREEHARTIRSKVAKFRQSLWVQDQFLLSTIL